MALGVDASPHCTLRTSFPPDPQPFWGPVGKGIGTANRTDPATPPGSPPVCSNKPLRIWRRLSVPGHAGAGRPRQRARMTEVRNFPHVDMATSTALATTCLCQSWLHVRERARHTRGRRQLVRPVSLFAFDLGFPKGILCLIVSPSCI